MLIRIILLILLGSFLSTVMEVFISEKPFTWWFDGLILLLYYIMVVRPEVDRFLSLKKKT